MHATHAQVPEYYRGHRKWELCIYEGIPLLLMFKMYTGHISIVDQPFRKKINGHSLIHKTHSYSHYKYVFRQSSCVAKDVGICQHADLIHNTTVKASLWSGSMGVTVYTTSILSMASNLVAPSKQPKLAAPSSRGSAFGQCRLTHQLNPNAFQLLKAFTNHILTQYFSWMSLCTVGKPQM